MRTADRVSVSLFVDPDDHERLVEQARLEDGSLSAAIRMALREHLQLPSGLRRRASVPPRKLLADFEEDA